VPIIVTVLSLKLWIVMLTWDIVKIMKLRNKPGLLLLSKEITEDTY